MYIFCFWTKTINLLSSPSKITEIGTYMTVTKAHAYVHITAPYKVQVVLNCNTASIEVYGPYCTSLCLKFCVVLLLRENIPVIQCCRGAPYGSTWSALSSVAVRTQGVDIQSHNSAKSKNDPTIGKQKKNNLKVFLLSTD